MEVLTTTPFGRRPVTATLMKRAEAAQRATALPDADKWELFRALCTAKAAFNVTDRELTVLNALLSFYPKPALVDGGQLVVFPSNRALAERAHGMAESTLRRHLAGLVDAGLLRRHDSPNGKRYAARDRSGDVVRAFGFDLRPLLERATEIRHAAAEAEAAADRLRRLREEITLMKRDALKLAAYGEETQPRAAWAPLQARLLDTHRALRRKLALTELENLRAVLQDILGDIRSILMDETEDMSGTAAETERHYQNSKPDSLDSDPCSETAAGGTDTPSPEPPHEDIRLPLALVLRAVPDLAPYASDAIRSWEQLHQTACFVRGMLGISPDAWAEAQRQMGPLTAAVVLACILQRADTIRSPGGYLRALTDKAGQGAFSPGPMVMALLAPARAAA